MTKRNAGRLIGAICAILVLLAMVGALSVKLRPHFQLAAHPVVPPPPFLPEDLPIICQQFSIPLPTNSAKLKVYFVEDTPFASAYLRMDTNSADAARLVAQSWLSSHPSTPADPSLFEVAAGMDPPWMKLLPLQNGDRVYEESLGGTNQSRRLALVRQQGGASIIYLELHIESNRLSPAFRALMQPGIKSEDFPSQGSRFERTFP